MVSRTAFESESSSAVARSALWSLVRVFHSKSLTRRILGVFEVTSLESRNFDLQDSILRTRYAIQQLSETRTTTVVTDTLQTLVTSQPSDLDRSRALHTVRKSLTQSVTCLMAASLIADPSFPSKANLPPLRPPAFNNHGHLLLLDYRLLLIAVWSVVLQIQETIEGWRRKHKPLLISSFIASLVILVVLGVITKSPVMGFISGGVVFGTIYLVGRKVLSLNELSDEISEIRALALRRLLQEQMPDHKDISLEAKVDEELSRIGDGSLGSERAPVLMIFEDNHPFPGFGKLVAETTFVCPPKKDSGSDVPNFESLRKSISSIVHGFVKRSGVDFVSFGPILTVYGRSLRTDSGLLDPIETGERVPPIWANGPNPSQSLEAKDPSVSFREYFAVQILFPNFMTAATIFARPFWAGDGIGYQLALTTLGPPLQSVEALSGKLLRHETDKLNQGNIGALASKKRVRAKVVFC